MYAISINSLYKVEVSLGAIEQTTKLHLILAATLKKSGDPHFKPQNYTDYMDMLNTLYIDITHNEKCMQFLRTTVSIHSLICIDIITALYFLYKNIFS